MVVVVVSLVFSFSFLVLTLLVESVLFPSKEEIRSRSFSSLLQSLFFLPSSPFTFIPIYFEEICHCKRRFFSCFLNLISLFLLCLSCVLLLVTCESDSSITCYGRGLLVSERQERRQGKRGGDSPFPILSSFLHFSVYSHSFSSLTGSLQIIPI